MSMKKFKKLLAGILTGAMMLGSMSVNAFATDETPTIDTTKTGTITINKYEEKNGDATPLAGVTFAAYKIADLTQGATGLQYTPTVTEITEITSETKYNDIKNAVDAAITAGELQEAASGKTVLTGEAPNQKASVTLKDLSLGVYLIVETDAPAQIVNKSANFLVSVPMTNAAGTDWIYDITAEPKNTGVYGGINLFKYGNNKDTKLNGVTFALQLKGEGDIWITKKICTTENGKISEEGLAPGEYRFVETSIGDNTGYIMDGKKVYEFTVTDAGQIKIGSEEAKDSGVIEVFNYKPDLDKEVQRENSNWDTNHDAQYSVGDDVPYRVTVSVPENIVDLKKFDVTDTPTNLTDDVESITIKYGDTQIEKDTVWSAAKDGTNGFKVTFVPTQMAAYAGKNLVIEYTAQLLDTAVTTIEGNKNTAKLEYSNAIYPDSNLDGNPNTPGTPSTNEIHDSAVVYTFQMGIVKENEDKEKLQNVEFELYKYTETGTPSLGDLKNNGELIKVKQETGSTYVANLGEVTTLVTDANGLINVKGLANGTYYLVETKTKAGYNLLKEPVAVTIGVQYATTWTVKSTYDKDGKLIKREEKTTTFTGTDDKNTNNTIGLKNQTIINKKGFTLPVTGGMGTVIFTVVGIILAFAGIMLITASRKKATK